MTGKIPTMNATDNAPGLSRSRFTRAALLLIAEIYGMNLSRADAEESAAKSPGEDFAIDGMTAMVFSEEAPLVPSPGKKDSRAVWARALPGSDGTSALVFLHGNNNYVTVDRAGVSRVPDWAVDDAAARAGASAKKAAPLAYGLDRIESQQIGRSPLLLVPEDAVLRTGAFWANEPASQYADPNKLGRLIIDCRSRYSALRRTSGGPALPQTAGGTPMTRLYLCGHSGAGLPLQEAAGSAIAMPAAGGVPTDLWLFDCTYWSNTANFSAFCEQWHKAGRLGGGKSASSRFVCIYRPKTQTEDVADLLRSDIARRLSVAPESLLKDHTIENYEADIRPALKESGVVFLRTALEHDEIPTYFIPRLLATSA